jgi:hypothetical protein
MNLVEPLSSGCFLMYCEIILWEEGTFWSVGDFLLQTNFVNLILFL